MVHMGSGLVLGNNKKRRCVSLVTDARLPLKTTNCSSRAEKQRQKAEHSRRPGAQLGDVEGGGV